MHFLNQRVVHLHLPYPYLISMLPKSQIKKLHFLEYNSTCTIISISRKGYQLIIQSVFMTSIHKTMFYFDANPISFSFFERLCNR